MIAFKERAELQDVGKALRMERRCPAVGGTLLIFASLGRCIFSHNLFTFKCNVRIAFAKVQAVKTNTAQFGLKAEGDCMSVSYERFLLKMGISPEVQHAV